MNIEPSNPALIFYNFSTKDVFVIIQPRGVSLSRFSTKN
ncbi:hypothetical protein AsAng_0004780 [Aureispira anguillae]|uniref:Uncharacterized protein n=1 Tax=Aureispira anguillae TaxID=2864201 RepID=A0A915YB08_9BACT|nr:hypothetical protein AsAng_0004780 [Aureispira anguillae]